MESTRTNAKETAGRAPRALAHCEDCGKAYRVPDPERVYTCRACRGTIHVDAAPRPQPDPLAGTRTCAECRAINPPGSQACGECGAELDDAHPLSSLEESRQARQEATLALKRGTRWMAAITWAYRLGTLAYGAVTVAAVLALSSANVPLGEGVLVVVLSTLLTVCMLVGAVRMLFEPFVWTLVIALAATAVSVVHRLGPDPLGVTFYWSVAWAVLAWAAVVPTLWFQRLITNHKDRYILHHAGRRTRHAIQGCSAEERHERLLRAMRKAGRRAWKNATIAAGLVTLASVLGTKMVLDGMRPQELSLALSAFEADWNAADLDALEGLFRPDVRVEQSRRLRGVVDAFGWERPLPRLGTHETQLEDGITRASYPLEGLGLSTLWALSGPEWFLLQLDLPVPPIARSLERFLAAWRANDGPAIAGFVPDEYEESMLHANERALRLRGWTSFPPILGTEVGEYVDGVSVVTLAIEGGEVSTKWHFSSEGRWIVTRLAFPELPKRVPKARTASSGGSDGSEDEEPPR